jgi:hypothetical protein
MNECLPTEAEKLEYHARRDLYRNAWNSAAIGNPEAEAFLYLL